MALHILGIVGCTIFTFLAGLVAGTPEHQVLAIISVIAGTGFGIIMQLMAIAIKMKN